MNLPKNSPRFLLDFPKNHGIFAGEPTPRDRLLGRQQPAHPARAAPHAAHADLPRAAGGALRAAAADAGAACGMEVFFHGSQQSYGMYIVYVYIYIYKYIYIYTCVR